MTFTRVCPEAPFAESSLHSGVIDLNECSLRKSETAKKANSFEIVSPTRVYVLYADTDASFKDWISALNKAVGMYLLYSLIVLDRSA